MQDVQLQLQRLRMDIDLVRNHATGFGPDGQRDLEDFVAKLFDLVEALAREVERLAQQHAQGRS
jgi:hypothetical protein